ncbi:hypothetical protein Q4493_04475 [Colwellia sp. 1_MG-2023]|uniref:hypothetical protein n=1 Tax=Colwellia sp. 1_MG-2023 TaxID=3062649 RepID=UPI0026E1EF01|nr:hypothetical protein [Colwellia sp. 1_MG-2023]MDO6445026.1 hypothetical protein [Colwellia sp. 1_MG-2023]
MDSSTPFSQQLTPRIFAIFGFSLFSLILALWLFQYREQQVDTLINEHLPAIEKSYLQQAKYIEINDLLATIINNTTSKSLLENHQLFLTKLAELKRLSVKQARVVESIILSEKAEQENIKRLTNNHQRNTLLRQSSVIQLQLVLGELNKEIADKTSQQAKLLQQINQDKVTDKVTASRAKAHANLTEVVNLLSQTSLAVKNTEVLFSRLNLQYSLDEFNFFADELLQTLALWEPQFQAFDDNNELTTPLLNVLYKLNQLLFVEQNALAKWRGHLRLSQAYFQRLQEQQLQLKNLRNDLALPVNTTQLMPSVFESLVIGDSAITVKHLQLIIFSIFILLMIILWGLLSQLKKRIKQQNVACVDHVKNTLAGEKVDKTSLVSAEENQLVALVENVVHPLHSENDYQALSYELNKLQKNIFEQAKLAFYVLSDDINSQGNAFARQLIFSQEKTNKHWQHAFSFSALKTIIKAGHQAERDKRTVQCEVKSRANQLITLTIFKQNNVWQGTIWVNDTQAELIEQIESLQLQLSSQQLTHRQSWLDSTEKLNNMLIRTMLQSQNVSIGTNVTSLQVYRQLTRILDWNSQLQMNVELQDEGSVQTFTDVETKNELFVLCHNIMVEANQQRNMVQLVVDKRVLSRAKVNVSLFHRTLTALSRLCLLEQFNATLWIRADVVDKNSGQQIICFTFDVIPPKNIAELPELITAFIGYDGSDKVVQKIQYLHTLLSATYCKNVTANITEQGFKLSVEMPIAYGENAIEIDNKAKEIDLNGAEFILVGSGNTSITNIVNSVESAKGSIETIEHVEHLIKQLNVKHLTNHPINAVILTSQVFKSDGHLINQHLNTLPKPITPKLIVLQASFTHALHSEGFFEYCDSPLESLTFVKYLAAFIASNQANNLQIPAEVFSQYRFASSQVEVLLAVKSAEKYQHFARLLHWLGFQVHLVCQADIMLNHWQSGRYLILLTEFESSPFVKMEVGKNVIRGVFSLGETVLKKATKQELTYTQAWRQAHIKNTLDVQNLVQLFAPWLKEKQLAIPLDKKVKSANKPVTAPIESSKTSNLAPEINGKVKDTDTSRIDRLLTANDIEEHQAFDLNLYAINQGSPEIAAFMLDDYMEEINAAISAISQAVKEKAFQHALEHTAEINKLTTILAAQDLKESAEELAIALNKKALPEVNAKLKLITQQYQTLTEFVQHI